MVFKTISSAQINLNQLFIYKTHVILVRNLIYIAEQQIVGSGSSPAGCNAATKASTLLPKPAGQIRIFKFPRSAAASACILLKNSVFPGDEKISAPQANKMDFDTRGVPTTVENSLCVF